MKSVAENLLKGNGMETPEPDWKLLHSADSSALEN